ncbi:MAG: hypothetical protein ABIH71_04850 [Candidatus Omnitrophota bacterium]
MNALKEIPTFLPNKSIVLNKPEEFLKTQYSSAESRNMEFYNEELRGRLGLAKFDTTALSGPILLQDQFWKYDGTWNYLIATTKDIYKYDFNSLIFEILTPLLIGTGVNSISIGTGASAYIVIGTGVNFTTEGIKSGDFIKIGTGGVTTESDWYEVATKDSATQLTLLTPAPAVTASQYIIRKCFIGEVTDQWHARTFQDKNIGETWLATNGVDTPIRYTGSGQVRAVSNLPTGFVTAKYVEVYKDRVIWMNTTESGEQPQRERWSAVADCEDYDDLDFLDFIDSGYWITGSLVWNGYHIVFRERDAKIGRWVGGTAVFSYEGNSSCSGVWASNSICSHSSKIFYYGPDNRFHSWNLITEEDLSEPITSYINNLDPNLEIQIFGYQFEAKGQMRWFIPYGNPSYNNACIVWDYINETLHIWEYQSDQACLSIGEFLNSTDVFIDDAVWGEYYVDEQDGYWDDRLFLDGAPVLVYGGYDGYLRRADMGYTDDGEIYDRVFESVRMNFKAPNLVKRLYKQQHWILTDLSGSITISLKTDDNINWRSAVNSISLIDSTRDIIKKNLTWNAHAQNFKTKIEAQNHFSILGWINYIYLKGNSVR